MYIDYDYTKLFASEEALHAFGLGMSYFLMFICETIFWWFICKTVFDRILPFVFKCIIRKVKSRKSSSPED